MPQQGQSFVWFDLMLTISSLRLTGRGSARFRVGIQCYVVYSTAYKYAVDVSKRLLDKWDVPLPAIPSDADLEIYLDAPLDPDEKTPISDGEWRSLYLKLTTHTLAAPLK